MPSPKRVVELLSYFTHLEDDRRDFEDTWTEVSEHSLARRQFRVKRRPGRQRTIRIYDSTSMDSNNLLAAALHALLTNPATNWFDLRFARPELNEIDEAIQWIEEVRQNVRHAFTRPGAGFATQVGEVYQDLPGFGTGCMFIGEEEGFGPFFTAIPLAELYIDVDHNGRIKCIFRKFTLKAWQAIDKFGEDKVPKAKKALDGGNASTPFDFVHHVRRRGKPIPGAINAAGMPWESIYISMSDKEIVREGGFFENPYNVARWTVDAGEMYGRCPGIDSLPNQKMLNAMWRSYIRSTEKVADPPLLVDNESVMPGSQLSITPSAQIVLNNDGGSREPVRYLESRARLELQKDLMETRTIKIEKAFHSEVIRAFEDPRMTATQVLQLAKLAQRLLSPLNGRMQEDFLNPMIQRVYGIQSRRPDFPVMPDFLFGQAVKIEYVSPVARAQKASESQAILDSFTATAAIAEADPSVMDNIDLDEAVRAVWEGNGTPVRLVRPRDDVIEIRRAQARIVEQEKEQERLAKGGETIAKLLPGIARLQEVEAA